MQQLNHTPTENPSTNVHGNQKSIYDMNIQPQELDKCMLIANTLKCKLNSQQSTKASWLVTKIKAIPKKPIQRSEEPIFLLRRTHETEVRNRKILTEFRGNLCTTIAAQKDSAVNYRSEFCDIASLVKLFLHNKDKTKIINIIHQGYHYHIDPRK